MSLVRNQEVPWVSRFSWTRLEGVESPKDLHPGTTMTQKAPPMVRENVRSHRTRPFPLVVSKKVGIGGIASLDLHGFPDIETQSRAQPAALRPRHAMGNEQHTDRVVGNAGTTITPPQPVGRLLEPRQHGEQQVPARIRDAVMLRHLVAARKSVHHTVSSRDSQHSEGEPIVQETGPGPDRAGRPRSGNGQIHACRDDPR